MFSLMPSRTLVLILDTDSGDYGRQRSRLYPSGHWCFWTGQDGRGIRMDRFRCRQIPETHSAHLGRCWWFYLHVDHRGLYRGS